MKKNRIAVIIFSLFLIFISIFIVQYNNAIKKPFILSQDTLVINVESGDGVNDVLNKLNDQKLVRNELLLKINMILNRRKVNLKEGMYEIDKNTDFKSFLNTLESGDNKDILKLTIPEGYTVNQIAELVEKEGIFTKDDFISAVKNHSIPEFVKQDSEKRYNLEGYLYPDTYIFKKSITPDQLIDLMLKRFSDILTEIENETGLNISSEDYEKTIIVASMIEKEAKVDKDRAFISSVIYNRLEKNMKLQIDATVIYGIGYHVDTVLNSHLRSTSPYNTYKYDGLPEGPIANPGKKSIIAALKPENTDYLYYILDKDDAHYFTASYDDFLNKKKELGY
ncbi:endolytic transglycosylase MltG [Clostridium sp. BJN0001]|uniref:endolytic transglycosylase MltG n=1 Tax=Clostridium sp. BJN0001 TaxID=2930219 RepID=UPI001FD2BCAC|nr:endolytic transglycosylase MltG [Clostridium sp. BJN0001]